MAGGVAWSTCMKVKEPAVRPSPCRGAAPSRDSRERSDRGVRGIRLVDLELLGPCFGGHHPVDEFGGGVLVRARCVDHDRVFGKDRHDRLLVARSAASGSSPSARRSIAAWSPRKRAEIERALIPVSALPCVQGTMRRAESIELNDGSNMPSSASFLHHGRDVDGARVGPGNLVVDQALIDVEAVLVDQDRRPHELRWPFLLVGQHERRDAGVLSPSAHSPSVRPRSSGP